MIRVFRRLAAACLLLVLPLLPLATAGVTCLHGAGADHAEHLTAADVADHAGHDAGHASSPQSAEASAPEPDCPMETGQTGCLVQPPLPAPDRLSSPVPTLHAPLRAAAADEPLAIDPAPIFRPPRA
jgi:hypothetical protein